MRISRFAFLATIACAAPAALAQGAKWNPVTPAAGSAADPPRVACMVYDDYRDRFVLSDGGITTEWDPTSSTWSFSSQSEYVQISALVFDSSRARTVRFGQDIAEWDGTAWAKVEPSGGRPVGLIRAAYDSSRAQILVVGLARGYDAGSYVVPSRCETWIYDGAAQQRLTQAAGSATTPSILLESPVSPEIAYDAGRDRFVLVGIVRGSPYDTAVWEYDPTAQSWTQVSTGGPPARTNFSMAYFPDRAATVVFGGAEPLGQSVVFGDTWEWNGYGWTQIPSMRTQPTARSSASMAYDAQRSLLLLYGGYVGGDDPFKKDLWSYGGVANVPPVLGPVGDHTVTAGQTLQFTVHGTDADGDPLTYSASGLPQGAAFDAQAATFRWTPTRAAVGAHQVTLAVSDGISSDSQTITITVTQPVVSGGGKPGKGGKGTVAGHHTMASAELVSVGTYPGRFCGSQDWYKVHLAAGDTVTFTITFLDRNGDLDLNLYDASGNLLDSSSTIDDYETITLTAPQDGFYFFQVTGYRGAKNHYDVTLQ